MKSLFTLVALFVSLMSFGQKIKKQSLFFQIYSNDTLHIESSTGPENRIYSKDKMILNDGIEILFVNNNYYKLYSPKLAKKLWLYSNRVYAN